MNEILVQFYYQLAQKVAELGALADHLVDMLRFGRGPNLVKAEGLTGEAEVAEMADRTTLPPDELASLVEEKGLAPSGSVRSVTAGAGKEGRAVGFTVAPWFTNKITKEFFGSSDVTAYSDEVHQTVYHLENVLKELQAFVDIAKTNAGGAMPVPPELIEETQKAINAVAPVMATVNSLRGELGAKDKKVFQEHEEKIQKILKQEEDVAQLVRNVHEGLKEAANVPFDDDLLAKRQAAIHKKIEAAWRSAARTLKTKYNITIGAALKKDIVERLKQAADVPFDLELIAKEKRPLYKRITEAWNSITTQLREKYDLDISAADKDNIREKLKSAVNVPEDDKLITKRNAIIHERVAGKWKDMMEALKEAYGDDFTPPPLNLNKRYKTIDDFISEHVAALWPALKKAQGLPLKIRTGAPLYDDVNEYLTSRSELPLKHLTKIAIGGELATGKIYDLLNRWKQYLVEKGAPPEKIAELEQSLSMPYGDKSAAEVFANLSRPGYIRAKISEAGSTLEPRNPNPYAMALKTIQATPSLRGLLKETPSAGQPATSAPGEPPAEAAKTGTKKVTISDLAEAFAFSEAKSPSPFLASKTDLQQKHPTLYAIFSGEVKPTENVQRVLGAGIMQLVDAYAKGVQGLAAQYGRKYKGAEADIIPPELEANLQLIKELAAKGNFSDALIAFNALKDRQFPRYLYEAQAMHTRLVNKLVTTLSESAIETSPVVEAMDLLHKLGAEGGDDYLRTGYELLGGNQVKGTPAWNRIKASPTELQRAVERIYNDDNELFVRSRLEALRKYYAEFLQHHRPIDSYALNELVASIKTRLAQTDPKAAEEFDKTVSALGSNEAVAKFAMGKLELPTYKLLRGSNKLIDEPARLLDTVINEATGGQLEGIEALEEVLSGESATELKPETASKLYAELSKLESTSPLKSIIDPLKKSIGEVASKAETTETIATGESPWLKRLFSFKGAVAAGALLALISAFSKRRENETNRANMQQMMMLQQLAAQQRRPTSSVLEALRAVRLLEALGSQQPSQPQLGPAPLMLPPTIGG